MKNETPHQPEPNDPLDQLLQGADQYIPDNGFTERVLTTLPTRGKFAWRRFAVLSVAILAGGALLAWQLTAGMGAFIELIPKHWSAFQWQSLILLVPMLAAVSSLIWAVYAVVGEED